MIVKNSVILLNCDINGWLEPHFNASKRWLLIWCIM